MKANEKAQEHLTLGHKHFFEEPTDMAALREFQQAVELAPDWPEGYGWLSSALEALGQIDEAIAKRREAMRLAPEDSRHPIALGVMMMNRQQYQKAIELLRQGIALKPHYGRADAHSFLADALLADGQTEEACKEWEYILTIEPMYPSYDEPHQEAQQMLERYGGGR